MTRRPDALKRASLALADAKRNLEAYANDRASSGKKTDPAKMAELLAAWRTAETDFDTAVDTERGTT